MNEPGAIVTSNKPHIKDRFMALRKLEVPPGVDPKSFRAGLRKGYGKGLEDGVELGMGVAVDMFSDPPDDVDISAST